MGVKHSPFEEKNAAIREALPDFDRNQDLLFFFFANGHAALYLGSAFADRAGPKGWFVREDAKALQQGVAVHVRVGAEKIRRLLKSARERLGAGRITCSCQHDHLYFLHRNGVILNAPIPLFGVTLYQRAITQGFCDEKGRLYKQSVAILGPSDQGVARLNETLKRLQVLRTLQYLEPFGVSHADLQLAAKNNAGLTRFLEIVDKVADPKLHDQISQQDVDYMTDFYAVAEDVGLQLIHKNLGDDHDAFGNRLGEIHKIDKAKRKSFLLKILDTTARRLP